MLGSAILVRRMGSTGLTSWACEYEVGLIDADVGRTLAPGWEAFDTVTDGYRPIIGFAEPDCDPLRCPLCCRADVDGPATDDDRGRKGNAVDGADWLLLSAGRRRDVVMLTIQSACKPRSGEAGGEGNCRERAYTDAVSSIRGSIPGRCPV